MRGCGGAAVIPMVPMSNVGQWQHVGQGRWVQLVATTAMARSAVAGGTNLLSGGFLRLSIGALDPLQSLVFHTARRYQPRRPSPSSTSLPFLASRRHTS